MAAEGDRRRRRSDSAELLSLARRLNCRAPLLRIGKIAQAVAEEVEAEHEQRDRQSREHREVARRANARPPLSIAPQLGRRLDAQSKKTERRFVEHGRPCRASPVTSAGGRRHDVPQQYARRRRAERTRRDLLELPRAQHLSSGESEPNPPDDRQREQRIRQARRARPRVRWPTRSRERHQDVRRSADHVVYPAAEIAGDRRAVARRSTTRPPRQGRRERK
jgi:hypothetical protein